MYDLAPADLFKNAKTKKAEVKLLLNRNFTLALQKEFLFKGILFLFYSLTLIPWDCFALARNDSVLFQL